MPSIDQYRLDRLERLGKTSRLELLGLGSASIIMLAVVLGCMAVILFHLQPLRVATAIATIIALAGWPLFALGRRHARRAGNKDSAKSYNS